MFEKGGVIIKIAIVCCSNGQLKSYNQKLKKLEYILTEIGVEAVFGKYIYEKDSVFSGSASERAECLMDFYKDDEIEEIFDISGGDIANEILPYIDYDIIAGSRKKFWGYSDLTTIINAIYAKTGKQSVLYQIRNLIYDDCKNQIENFTDSVVNNGDKLYELEYSFIQGEYMRGVVAGGNIRCLLKLAGTEYFPDMKGKILLLESFSGQVAKMVTYLNQLKQMGVFQLIEGILLGTFSEMESKECSPGIVELVREYAGKDIPIAVTSQIGHGTDSKAIVIGKEYCFTC